MEEKITSVLDAWGGMRSAKSFAGYTFDQYKETVKPSLDVRERIANLERQMQEAIAEREAADAVSLEATQRVVHAVRADREEGENGPLYAAMGFVRKSLRATGLTRRRVKQHKEVEPNGAS
jgi:hypothetical protein